jgi:hypothetical protein
VASHFSPSLTSTQLSGYDNAMFKCGQCGSTEFQLMLQQDRHIPVQVTVTDEMDMRIEVNGRSYVADLPFMNRYAVCKHCESIRKWQYFFPKQGARF